MKLSFVATLFLLSPAWAQTVTVDITPGHSTNSFSPVRSLGAGVDRDPNGSLSHSFSQPNLGQMLSAGWGPVSYRLNTELSVQAWHWNPTGTWSDPSGHGYFTGSASAGPIRGSFGYNLPHRGVTSNYGTSSGYSRVDDGDVTTYWKSNPYLTSPYTGESDALHAQWIVADLGSTQPIDAVRIDWANPYATNYQVQYWTGNDPIGSPGSGNWVTFPMGTVSNGTGGSVTLRVAASPMTVQYVRVSMSASSNTCDTHGASDRRNCLGYAMSEIYVGMLDSQGEFIDYVTHSADSSQTLTYCSSVDPWHQPADIAISDGDQPGFDLVYQSGITRGLPAVVSVPMLYDNPTNAAHEIAYLESKGYPIEYVELGEEPDGQFVLPEDDAALFLQWAAALHAVDPNLRLAGPVFEGTNSDILVWPDAQGNTSWFNRYLNYLSSHGGLGNLNVMTFEHYPFTPCYQPWETLYVEPALVKNIVQTWRNDGLPPNVPMAITEYNTTYNYSSTIMSIYGALWNADFLGTFLTVGGSGAFYYQYEPLPMFSGCKNSWGTFGMFNVSQSYAILQPTSQYFSAQMITQQWADPVDLPHIVYSASSDITDSAGNILVTAYALFRPDGQYGLMLVNKDQNNGHSLTVNFRNGGSGQHFSGSVSMITFDSGLYVWHPLGPNGYAQPDGPAVTTMVAGGAGTIYTLPAASLTVLRGYVQ